MLKKIEIEKDRFWVKNVQPIENELNQLDRLRNWSISFIFLVKECKNFLFLSKWLLSQTRETFS